MSRRYSPYVSTVSSTSHSPRLSGSPLTPDPSPRSRPRTPLPSSVDADEMATQTITYMNVLADHAAAIRAHPQSEGVYQRILDQGRVLSLETKRPLLDRQGQENLCRQMEAIIQRPATSAEDHLEICCAAHTLLLLQNDILDSLPYPECHRVEEKINELRAARRRKFARREGRFHGLVPPPALPPIERPKSRVDRRVVSTDILSALLDFPPVPAIIGKQFHLINSVMKVDLFYRVCRVEMSSDGYKVAVQYEGTRDATIVGLDEIKDLLECSVIVSTDSNLTGGK